MFIERLEKQNPVHLQIVEDHLNLDLEDDNEIIGEAEDTLTILNHYVEALETQADKNEVNKVLREIYSEALAIT